MNPLTTRFKNRRPLAVSSLLAVMLPAFGQAATVVYQQGVSPAPGYVSSDTMIRGDGNNALLNFGTGTYNIAGKVPNGALRTLYSFSLTDIPAGAVITSVSLTVRGERNDTGSPDALMNFDLHQLVGGFTEGTGSLAGTAGAGATWNERAPGTAWTTPGGDYLAPVLSSIAVNPRSADETTYTFGSSLALVAAVQNALNGGGTFSMIMKLNGDQEALADRRVFFLYGDDAVELANRPALTVTYEVIPEPAAAMLGAIAGVAFMVRRRR